MTTLQPAKVTWFAISNLCTVCSFIMIVISHFSVRVGAIFLSVILVHALMSYSVSFIKLFFNTGFITTLCGLISNWFSSSACCLVRIRIDFSAKFSTSKNCCDWPSRSVIRLIFIIKCSFFRYPWDIIHHADYYSDNLSPVIVIDDKTLPSPY